MTVASGGSSLSSPARTPLAGTQLGVQIFAAWVRRDHDGRLRWRLLRRKPADLRLCSDPAIVNRHLFDLLVVLDRL